MKKLALPLLAFVLFFGNCHSTAIKNRSDEKPADVAKTPRTDTVLEQEYYDFYNSIHLLPATMAVNAERIYIQRYNQMKDSTPIIFSKEDSLYMMKQITRWPDDAVGKAINYRQVGCWSMTVLMPYLSPFGRIKKRENSLAGLNI